MGAGYSVRYIRFRFLAIQFCNICSGPFRPKVHRVSSCNLFLLLNVNLDLFDPFPCSVNSISFFFFIVVLFLRILINRHSSFSGVLDRPRPCEPWALTTPCPVWVIKLIKIQKNLNSRFHVSEPCKCEGQKLQLSLQVLSCPACLKQQGERLRNDESRSRFYRQILKNLLPDCSMQEMVSVLGGRVQIYILEWVDVIRVTQTYVASLTVSRLVIATLYLSLFLVNLVSILMSEILLTPVILG